MANEGSKTAVTSPPTGTGNVPGLGEAFSINLSTGQGVYSYKIVLPEGVAGHTPPLILEYAHGAGHGAFGLGWRVPLRSITRRLDFGVPSEGIFERYMDSGNDILPMPDGTFAARVETVFSRYSRVRDGWRIEERDGMVHELGSSAAGRLAEPGHPERIDEWLLERSLDPSGNIIEYNYLIDEGMAYLAEVRYAIYAVRFIYEDRPDPRLNGRTGYLRKRGKLCKKIELFIDPGPNERRIRSWIFTYTQAAGNNVSLLASIQMISHGVAADGPQDVVRVPLKFQYTPFELQQSTAHWMESSDGSSPPPLSDPDVALVILDNAPLPGVLSISNGRQYYWRNLGNGTWAPPRPVTRVPAVSSFDRSGLAFIDMDASGTADLLVAAAESLPGYYENGGLSGWSRFVAFPRGRRSAPFWISDQVRLSDINGDGRIDAIMSTQRSFAVWLNEGENGWSDLLLVPKDGLPDFSDSLVFLADMSGDGLDDLVRVRSGLVEYWPGLGYGRFGERQVMGSSPRLRDLTPVPGRVAAASLMLVDVDGDGCADMVRVTANGVEVYLNQNGISFSNPIFTPDTPPHIPGTVRAINMRGRSGTGLIWNTPRGRQTGYVSLEFGSEQPAYLLNRIENGLGLVSEIFYRSAIEDFCWDRQTSAQWDTNFPFPYLVVAGTRETDQVSGSVSEVNYRYHEAHFEPSARQFQGFRRTERQEIGDESRADTLTVFHFLMGQDRLPGKGPEHSALNGMLQRTEVYSIDGSPQQDQPYKVEESDYDIKVLHTTPDSRRRTFISVKRHKVMDLERTEDLRCEEKAYTYDVFGNVLQEEHRGYGQRDGAVQPERIRITEIDYAQSATTYLVDKPARIVVRDTDGTILSEERRYYDGLDFVGLPLGDAIRGLLTRNEQLVLSDVEFNQHYAGMNADDLGYFAASNADGEPAFFVNTERHAYDAHGQKLADEDALGNQTSYSYDASGLFRTALSTSLGVTRFEYDRAIRQPVRITYPDGTEALFAYDAQGRVLTTALPGESLNNPPTTYSYNDAVLPTSRTGHFRPSHNSADEAIAVTYFDGHGKEFQQRVQVAPGQFVVSGLRLLNPWGDLNEEYEPTFDNTASFSLPPTANRPRRQIYYEALGRVIRIVNFNDGVSTAEYRPFEIITKDANDNDASPENAERGQFNTPHCEEFDVFRYRIRTAEDLGNGQSMNYSYLPGPKGELLQVTDDRGVVATYQYDRLGQRLLIQHREAGVRRLWYDGRGVVVRSLDANGNDMRADIDARRRLTRLELNGAILEEYTYDDPARHALGRLAQVVYPGGSQSFDYDTQGRLVVREYHFDNLAAPQRLVYEYDRLGRKIAVSHHNGPQAGLTIRHVLTANGWVRAIPGFVNQVNYDPRGLPEQITYQNGVVALTTYTPGPGRIATHSTIGPIGQVLEQVEFEYDRMEMLLSSNDTTPGGRGLQNFSYDPLYQLTSAATHGANAPLMHQYSYTHGMNLGRFDEMDSNLHYDDLQHPNRLAGLTQQNGPRFDVTYDNNGNLMTLPAKTFHYNAKNELVRFEAADGLVAEYCYDHKGMRVSKTITDAQGAVNQTFFIGDLVELRTGQPAYFVRLGALRVAVVADGQTRFVHGDYLGSTAFFTDGTGTKIAAIAYRPFGNVASSNGVIDFRTFGVHPFDAESELFYMRRRYYAPAIGRFITPDPLALYQPTVHLHNPKALHPYAFVANDPLNKTDLTGLSFWSVVGAIVGVLTVVALTALVVATGGAMGAILFAGFALFGSMLWGYMAASGTWDMPASEFFRGFLIGLNAGLNVLIGSILYGPVVGVALGVINFLAAFDTLAGNKVYQGILGWSSWIMPMSWLATGIGLIFFVVNIITRVTMMEPGDQRGKIKDIRIDWETGTIVTVGGGVYISGIGESYNLGNFAYIHPGSGDVIPHETGHTLNVAAFGSVIHFIGAIDQAIVRSTPENAYAERLADSHDPNAAADREYLGQEPIIPIWV